MKSIFGKSFSVGLFFVVFCMIYNPFGIKESLSGFHLGYFVNIVILGCIVLISTCITRLTLKHVSNRYSIGKWYGFAWSIGEMMVDAAFMAMFIALIKKTEYSVAISSTIQYSVFCLIYPYLFYSLIWRSAPSSKEDTLIKFYDEHKRLKLSVSEQSVLYIGAEMNYIKVHYLESGKAKEFLIRNSMKSQDGNVRDYGLVRCHRSYIINPRHVTSLKKEKDGPICAVLDYNSTLTVPVSKQYYDALSALL